MTTLKTCSIWHACWTEFTNSSGRETLILLHWDWWKKDRNERSQDVFLYRARQKIEFSLERLLEKDFFKRAVFGIMLVDNNRSGEWKWTLYHDMTSFYFIKEQQQPSYTPFKYFLVVKPNSKYLYSSYKNILKLKDFF